VQIRLPQAEGGVIKRQIRWGPSDWRTGGSLNRSEKKERGGDGHRKRKQKQKYADLKSLDRKERKREGRGNCKRNTFAFKERGEKGKHALRKYWREGRPWKSPSGKTRRGK